MVSQLLTLFTTPVIYLAFDRLARRVGKRRGIALCASGIRGGHEYLALIHPPTSRYHAADRGAGAHGCRRLPFIAGLAAAPGGVSHH
jgi:hypothetical protein